MSDLLVDLRGLLRGLHEHGVDYLVSGAVAMVFYGHVRATDDLDIVVSSERENLIRMGEWLTSMNATVRREGWAATMLTPLGQVDIVQRLPALPEWPRLIEEAEIYEIEGMRVPVLNRQTWIDLKRPPRLEPRPCRHRRDRAARWTVSVIPREPVLRSCP